MKIFPSLSFFDRETEALFKQRLFNKTSKSAMPMAIIFSIALLTFTISELDNWTPLVAQINYLRIFIIFVVFFTLFVLSKVANDKKLTVWRVSTAICCICLLKIFYLSGLEYGGLGEGGPMLVLFSLLLMPTLSLADKAIFIAAMFAFFIWMKHNTSVSMEWTPMFFGLGSMFAIATQHQLDLLLRHQFRAELIETEKAATDRLTGTFNRHGLDTFITQSIQSLEDEEYIHIVMTDIDSFKLYNDTYGHLEGDRVLTKVSNALNKLGADRVVRFGGEEFILIEKSTDEVPSWLSNIVTSVSDLKIVHSASTVNQYVTISAGVVSLGAKNKATASTTKLLTKADELLYQVKHSGKNACLHEVIS